LTFLTAIPPIVALSVGGRVDRGTGAAAAPSSERLTQDDPPLTADR
jgi:hypothetical protein